MGKKKEKEEIKNVLIKMPISVYADIGLKYLNAKLSNPNISKNDFLIFLLKKGIEKIEENQGEKNE